MGDAGYILATGCLWHIPSHRLPHYRSGGVLGLRTKVEGGKLTTYACGEDIPGQKMPSTRITSARSKERKGHQASLIVCIFFIHLFLVSILIAYFPFSKLVHMAGIFLSPTRNLSNNNRVVRHVNPWSYPVKVHTYDEYEDEFREKMVEVGLPVEKMPETPAEEEAESPDEDAGLPEEDAGQQEEGAKE